MSRMELTRLTLGLGRSFLSAYPAFFMQPKVIGCKGCQHQFAFKRRALIQQRPLSSSSPSRVHHEAEAGPYEVNYTLVQNMGEGFRRGEVPIAALGKAFNMVYGEWTIPGKSSEESPAIICIHGTPATEGAFRPIGSLISSRGFRVLTVNFPGAGHTEIDPGRRYDFSALHKGELVKAFIVALGLKSVAMVISHSMGSEVACRVAADPALEGVIQSACYICGISTTRYRGHRKYMTSLAPYVPWLYKAMYLPLIGQFVTRFLASRLEVDGFRGKTSEATALCFYEIYKIDFQKFAENLACTAKKQQPVLLMYSMDDHVVEPELIDGNIAVLGIAEENAKEIDKHGCVDKSFSSTELRRAVRFEKGTHRLQFQEREKTVKEIVSLLEAMGYDLASIS